MKTKAKPATKISQSAYEKLRNLGMSQEEIEEWMSLPKAGTKEKNSVSNDTQQSNVVFKSSRSIEDCEVTVNGVKLSGVLKASLVYDADCSFPVLELYIAAPQII